MTTNITLYNSLTRKKEPLAPLDPTNVRMYVCGPTVYARPHIGNARSVVVYDVLFRLLKHVYGEAHVTYARNITDVDDKINAAAMERGISIQALTEEVTEQFHADMGALNCLRPTVEPKATEHIAQIIAMIEQLIARGHAYAAEGHVLFDVTSDANYGHLSRRSPDDMIAGARVEIAPYKKNPGDFVLWKPASEKDDASSKFDSPWGVGRPGWHIECSAMSTTHLGESFDIHGGGADLMFPHHENECAQSRCAHPQSDYARLWVHNGFLTVNGEKMSKSLGNFITVYQLLAEGKNNEVIRYALLSTIYNKPLDWNDKVVSDAEKALNYFYKTINISVEKYEKETGQFLKGIVSKELIEILADNLNTPKALAYLHQKAKEINSEAELRKKALLAADLRESAYELLGLLMEASEQWLFYGSPPDLAKGLPNDFGGWENAEDEEQFYASSAYGRAADDFVHVIEQKIATRLEARKAKNWAESDRIRDELKALGIILEDRPDGTTDWRRA
jgi:cysteinyl-tRNA synthetase